MKHQRPAEEDSTGPTYLFCVEKSEDRVAMRIRIVEWKHICTCTATSEAKRRAESVGKKGREKKCTGREGRKMVRRDRDRQRKRRNVLRITRKLWYRKHNTGNRNTAAEGVCIPQYKSDPTIPSVACEEGKIVGRKNGRAVGKRLADSPCLDRSTCT